MPQATDELRNEWPGGDSKAVRFLQGRGFVLTSGWNWKAPKPGYDLSNREESAICYLIDEWDFGGLEPE